VTSARSHRSGSNLAKFAGLFLCAIPSLAHAQEPTATITVTTQVVAIDAVVRGPEGQPLLTLDKDAFTLKVDGKPTPIRYFNRDNDLPLTVGLMIDASASQRVYFDEEELSGDIFFTNILTRPQDRALVVRFDSHVLLLQKMTTRLTDLHNALRTLDYSTPTTSGTGNGTLLYDAIAAVSKSVIGNEAGRRALVILTDGDDNGSRASLSDAIHAAQLSGVAIYSVLYSGEMLAGGGRYPASAATRPSGIDIMQQISKATGGRAFIVGAGTPIAQIYADIEQDLRSQYRFGFTPTPSKPGKYHSLELHTADKHQTIQTRAGYYTPE
jgi:Ca-activated chloride channel family protein